MATDPRIRASDDDRDKTATLLREHHAAGRLTPEEFNDRLDKAFAAKTVGDLDDLMSDLPGIDLYRLPGHGLSRGPTPGNSSALAAMASSGMASRPPGRLSPVWQAAWGSWLSVSTILVVIWALGGMGYPWFAWVAGPWGAVILARWISGGHPTGGGPAGGHQHGGHQHDHRDDRHQRRNELPGDDD